MRGLAMAVWTLTGKATVDKVVLLVVVNPSPNPLPATERGRREGVLVLLPLSVAGRGLGGGVFALASEVEADRERTMADDLALDEIDNVLRDVRGVVRDALQVPSRREQRQALLDHLWRRLHGPDQFGDDRVVVAVHLVIEAADEARQAGVEIDEGIEALPHHRRRQVGHALQFLRNGDLRETAAHDRP